MLKIKGTLSASQIKQNALIDQNIDPQSMSMKRCSIRMQNKRELQRKGKFKHRSDAHAWY